MKLTRYSDYSLRVCLYLAMNPDRLVSISEIVEAYDLPKGNVMKLATDLVSAGVLQSVRGRAGGLRLAQDASELTVGRIVRHTEGTKPLVDCAGCMLAPGCGLICIMAEASEALFAVLDRYTLQDVVTRSPGALDMVLSGD